jgi:hypothetical protein
MLAYNHLAFSFLKMIDISFISIVECNLLTVQKGLIKNDSPKTLGTRVS